MRLPICILRRYLGTLLLVASASASAFSTAPVDRFAFSVSVAPRVSVVGAPRSLIANGCVGPGVVDDSAVAAGRLVLRMTLEALGCVQAPTILTYTPRSIGTLRVIMMMPDGSTIGEAQMETVAAGARSTVNLDGMWFDPATNGSGISFHHSASSDNVFGTWFLFGGGSRWYSLQGLQWMQGGAALSGVAYEAKASLQATCVFGSECPRAATDLRPVGSLAVTFIDQNNLRVEAFDQHGNTAFVSLLKRLLF